MTAEVALADARARIDRIKTLVGAAREDIIEAYRQRDWITLGYESWDAMCVAEFAGARIALPVDDRRELVADLRGEGMSTRAIGSAIGVNHATVVRDVAATGADAPVDTVTSLDGRQRPAKVTTTTRTTEATKVERAVDLATGEILGEEVTAEQWTAEHPEVRVEPSAEVREWEADTEATVRAANVRARFARWLVPLSESHLFDPAEVADLSPERVDDMARSVARLVDFVAAYRAAVDSNRHLRIV